MKCNDKLITYGTERRPALHYVQFFDVFIKRHSSTVSLIGHTERNYLVLLKQFRA